MIKRIVGFSMLFLLIIALSLSLIGITHVSLSTDFMAFLKQSSNELNDFKIAIPDIPQIPVLSDSGGIWDILNVLVNFVNGIVSVINVLIMILNALISLLQFLVIIIKNVIGMISNNTENSYFGSSEELTSIISSTL